MYVLQLLATESPVLPDEQRLLDKLFRTYDNSVRPVYNSTRNVEVAFGINLIQIMDMVCKQLSSPSSSLSSYSHISSSEIFLLLHE